MILNIIRGVCGCREVGKVDTGHHKVALTLRSILDVDEPPESHASPDQVELIPDTACNKEAGHNSDTQYGSQSMDDEAEASRNRYKAGVEAAAATKQRSVSPLQVADTPMTDSPQLQQAPKLKAAASPTGTGNVDVPDMSKLKIGNQPGCTNLASKPEGYEADVAEDMQPEDPLHARKPLRPGTIRILSAVHTYHCQTQGSPPWIHHFQSLDFLSKA